MLNDLVVPMSIARVDSDAMRKRAWQLREEAKKMGSLMLSLRQLTDDVRLEWQSAESEEFERWYLGSMRPSLASGQEVVNGFATLLEGGADCETAGLPEPSQAE